MTHKKIQMNPKLKNLRMDFFNSYMGASVQDNKLASLPNQVKAEMVYRMHLAGIQINKACARYGISPSYQREVRQLKEDEWKLSLLNEDEDFLNFIKEIKPNPEEDTLESISFFLMLLDYLYLGETITKGETTPGLIKVFNEICKAINDIEQPKPTQEPAKNADVRLPCQSVKFAFPNNNQNINDIRGMMGYV